MIKLNRAVIVEGKYDKIALENIIDTEIFTTDGFGIFKNKEKCELIRLVARKKGIIIMTDTDSSGAMIRSYLKKICADCDIINVYVPQLLGKEKRKSTPSKQGYLGVEGVGKDAILTALERSGVFSEEVLERQRKITKTDMFIAGLSGNDDSSYKRKSFAEFVSLPVGVSPNALLDALNAIYSYEEFIKVVEEWHRETDKN